MKLTVKSTSRFQKELKLLDKRGYDLNKLTTVVKMLANGDDLPPHYKDHPLKGRFKNSRECHIEPDWLLIYEINKNDLILYLTRTGTHAELFGK